MGKKDAVQKLLAKNFEQLSQDLQVLLLDIALFIIPSGLEQIDEAARVLSRMNGATDTNADTIKIQIKQLRMHCALSIEVDRIDIHDIYMEYAKNIPMNSTSYVNATWSRLILDAAPSSSASPVKVYLEYSEARTVNISSGFMEVVDANRDINLHLKIRAKTKAVIVREDRDHFWTRKCSLFLSGELSSLVLLQMENLSSFLTARGTNLSNLDRLELINPDKKRLAMPTYSGSLLDSIGRLIIQNWEGLPVRWPWSPWITDIRRSLATSGETLRVLKLVNAGVRSLEDIGRCCPRLEVLEVGDERHELMSVSIGSSTPMLKRLVIGNVFRSFGTGSLKERAKYTHTPTRSSKLVVQLGECRELEEAWVDVSSFDQVEVMSPVPTSRLRQFGLLNDRRVDVMGMALVSRGSLSQLRTVHICCKKVETLDFKQHCLPLLEKLYVFYCNSLTHISICPSCLPKLKRFYVCRCNELHEIEGLGGLVKEHLKKMELEFLPHLQCELRLGGVQFKHISVKDCPGVKISYDVLVSCERMKWIHLDNVQCIEEELASDGISVDEMDEDESESEGMSVHEMDDEDWESDGISEHQMDDDLFDSDNADEEGPDENIVAAFTMQNPSSNVLMLQHPVVSPTNSQKRLTFWRALNNLEILSIDGSFGHLQKIEGIEHLHSLRCLYLCNLRSLTRVLGIWPPSLYEIEFRNCPRLQEVPFFDICWDPFHLSCIDCVKLKALEGWFDELFMGQLEDWVFEIQFVGCESMETFPMEDLIVELGWSWDEEFDPSWFSIGRPPLRVCGSKFASVKVMEEWLERAEWNSYLSVAALDCLSWKYVVEGAEDALEALRKYFSSGALSQEIRSRHPRHYDWIKDSLRFSYSYRPDPEERLSSACQKRLSRLERIKGRIGF